MVLGLLVLCFLYSKGVNHNEYLTVNRILSLVLLDKQQSKYYRQNMYANMQPTTRRNINMR